MKIKWFAVLPLIFFAVLAAFFWKGLSLNPHRIPSVFINRAIPAFKLGTLENPMQMMSDKALKGKVVLLNVFASWCVACHDEHPLLMDIALHHRIPIYGLDYKDSRKNAKSLLSQYGNPYTKIAFDQNGNVAINWGVYGTPETFLIDKKGIIRFKQIGVLTRAVWDSKMWPLIQKLRAEKA